MTPQEYDSQIGAAYDSGDYQKVHRLAQQWLNEGEPSGAYHMAAASNFMEQYIQASREIQKYLSMKDDADGWALCGQIELNGNNYYAAYQAFDKAAAKGDNNALG